MKLYTQDRERIIEMPREIWVTTYSGRSGIFSTSLEPQLAEYKTEGRAKVVLAELFDYYRNGKNSYALPKE